MMVEKSLVKAVLVINVFPTAGTQNAAHMHMFLESCQAGSPRASLGPWGKTIQAPGQRQTFKNKKIHFLSFK